MTFSLYDATIPSNLQILRAVDRVLDKAEAFCAEQGTDAAELIAVRRGAADRPAEAMRLTTAQVDRALGGKRADL